MPDKMYVVRLENDFKDITRTLLRCRLLSKMKGMKPTCERYIRRRSQTGTRKSLTGPTPEKDNAANPEPLRYKYKTIFYVGPMTCKYCVYISEDSSCRITVCC